MKKSEKVLIGLAMLVGAVALFVMIGMPQLDAVNANQSQLSSLNEDIKNFDAQKVNLTNEINVLEKNSNLPSDVTVLTYTPQNRALLLKGMMDKVVMTATRTGNIFISLAPVDMPSPAAAASTSSSTLDSKTIAPQLAPADKNTAGIAPPPASELLDQFQYTFVVRGSYSSIQQFLSAMAEEKSLIHIQGIKMENEYMPGLGTSSSTPSDSGDPLHPIKLTSLVVLSLQPQK